LFVVVFKWGCQWQRLAIYKVPRAALTPLLSASCASAECCHHHCSQVTQLKAGGKLKWCSLPLLLYFLLLHFLLLLHCSPANATAVAFYLLSLPLSSVDCCFIFIYFIVCYCSRTATAIAVAITLLLLAMLWHCQRHYCCCLLLLMPSSLPPLDACIVAGRRLIVASCFSNKFVICYCGRCSLPSSAATSPLAFAIATFTACYAEGITVLPTHCSYHLLLPSQSCAADWLLLLVACCSCSCLRPKPLSLLIAAWSCWTTAVALVLAIAAGWLLIF